MISLLVFMKKTKKNFCCKRFNIAELNVGDVKKEVDQALLNIEAKIKNLCTKFNGQEVEIENEKIEFNRI